MLLTDVEEFQGLACWLGASFLPSVLLISAAPLTGPESTRLRCSAAFLLRGGATGAAGIPRDPRWSVWMLVLLVDLIALSFESDGF